MTIFESVDINKFSGLWYEVAKSPNLFERECDYSTAEYLLTGNDLAPLTVMNSCYSKGRKIKEVSGKAYKTSFSYAFSVRFKDVPYTSLIPNYFVYWINQSYTLAIIISPSGNIWFLSRKMYLDEDEYSLMQSKLKLFPILKPRRVVTNFTINGR